VRTTAQVLVVEEVPQSRRNAFFCASFMGLFPEALKLIEQGIKHAG
jgi:hypothetical protein